MPNTFAAAGIEQLASAVVAGLWDGGILLGTIYRDGENSLVVGKGDTVTIRSPQVVPAANFTAPATITDINEGKIAVAIDQQPYSQTAVSAREKTLEVEDFAAQVVQPQVAGIAEFIDAAVAAKLETTTGTASGATWREAIASGFGVLGANKVPVDGRWLAIAPDVAGSLLTDVVFVSADTRGDQGDALNNAVLGRLYGFNILVSPFITAGTAVAYHNSAIAGVFRTPVSPEGGAVVATANLRGVSAQVIYAYSPSTLSDLVTVTTLFGLGTSSVAGDFAKRAVKVTVAVGP